ncbi:LacI family DNA-binding transcriptional regulator [Microbacterium sediminicola]|uniref:LacI family DNA-binding transcriptional regulator n=1 Tax=Microbacterium sediminicola TaxID=415210 RepID=A0ABP4TFQ5_9MICO
MPTPTPAPRVTIRDVAQAAGVSAATVSFVLNDTPGQTLRPETRVRVRAAASELGYQPHRLARALREGSSRLVLLKVGALPATGRSLPSLIAGMEAELHHHGYALVVSYGDPGRDTELLEAVAPHTVLDLPAIYASPEATADGGWAEGFAAHTANQLGHLIDRGHRSIAFVVPHDPATRGLARLRVRFAQDVAAQRHAALRVVELSPSASVVEMLRALRPAAQSTPPTAVAAFDDDTAFAILSAMVDLGWRAPDDLAVIGFDEGPHAALWHPALTSVRIEAEEFGRRAALRAIGLDPGDWIGTPSTVTPRATT